MKTHSGKMKVRALALAVQGAASIRNARARRCGTGRGPDDFRPITRNSGCPNVSRDSAKFGEYTGLSKSGGYLNGNFDFRGGDAYGDGNGMRRWQLTGSDLGLSSRSLGASISDQGQWSIGVNYDQLTHYTSDSYQTPYSGTIGGNTFTLPGFGAITGNNTRTGDQRSAAIVLSQRGYQQQPG